MLVFKGPVGPGGALAGVPGVGEHDPLLHGGARTLPRQRDHQLPDPHLLVHPAGLNDARDERHRSFCRPPLIEPSVRWVFASPGRHPVIRGGEAGGLPAGLPASLLPAGGRASV